MAKAVVTGDKGLDAFRAQFDKNVIVPNSIRTALAELAKVLKAGDKYESEQEFIRRCGVSNTDFAMFRDAFEKFYVNVGTVRQPKRMWFGTESAAAAARKVVSPS